MCNTEYFTDWHRRVVRERTKVRTKRELVRMRRCRDDSGAGEVGEACEIQVSWSSLELVAKGRTGVNGPAMSACCSSESFNSCRTTDQYQGVEEEDWTRLHSWCKGGTTTGGRGELDEARGWSCTNQCQTRRRARERSLAWPFESGARRTRWHTRATIRST